jgi:hypothetical protein
MTGRVDSGHVDASNRDFIAVGNGQHIPDGRKTSSIGIGYKLRIVRPEPAGGERRHARLTRVHARPGHALQRVDPASMIEVCV